MFALTLLLAAAFQGGLVLSEDPARSWLMTKVTRGFRNDGADFGLADPRGKNDGENGTEGSEVTRTETGEECAVQVLTYHFRSEIVFRYATTSLRSRMRNCGDRAQQLNFTVTLQDTAFISNFSMEMDGVVYKSSVKKKDVADSDFNQAVASGLGAAQVAVSARDANSYIIYVNIEPKSDVTFNLTYEELLIRRLNVYDHVITLNPGQAVIDMRAEVNIFESQNITRLSVSATNDASVNSSSLALSDSVLLVNRTSDKTAHVFYSPRKHPASFYSQGEQLHVRYDVDRSSEAGNVVLMDGFFVHFYAPKSLTPISKHVVFALDTSGSMWGRKLQQTQDAMAHILKELREGDFFSIITFGTKVEEWSPLPQNLVGIRTAPTTLEVNARNIDSAIDYIKTLQASGGTNIITALRKSLQITARREYNLVNVTDQEEYNRILPKPMVVFLTDGVPTDGELIPTLILAKVRAANAQVKATIFTLAFGDGASQAFLRRLALQNNGFSRRIYEAADVSLQLQSFYEEISSPLLSNVTFVYKHHKVNSKLLTQHMFPTYYGGSELVVLGKLEEDSSSQDADNEGSHSGEVPIDRDDHQLSPEDHQGGDFVVEISCAKANGILERSKRRPSMNKPIVGYKAKRSVGVLERMWAYLSIKQHLDQDIISEDVVVSQDPSALRVNHRKEALRIALKYEFVTSLTSLVVLKTSTNGSQAPIVQLDVPVEEIDREPSPVVENNAGVNSYLGSYIVPKPLLSFTPGIPMVSATDEQTFDPVMSSPTTSLPLHKDSTMFRNFTLAELVWLPDHLDSSGHLVISNASGIQLFTIYEPDLTQSDATPLACTTPSGVAGICRPVAHCVQPAFTEDFNTFVTYFCTLGTLAGVCCPTGMSFLRI